MPLPTDAAGAVEGQLVCRQWPARVAFTERDRTTEYHQYTDTPAGTYWSSTQTGRTATGGFSISVGVPFAQAKWFRGRETTTRTRSRCPDPSCCRLPDARLSDRWSEKSWPSASVHAQILAPLPTGTFPGVDEAEVYAFLERHAIAYRVVRIDENEPLPPSIAAFSALVLMGGPMSVNDDLPWIASALSLIRQALDAGKPVLGHCLGGQLISKALGGTVTRNPVREIGWLPVQRVRNAQADAWLGDLPDVFDVFHWHGETFSIPAGATRILGSAACAHQGFVIDDALALQCHVEMTADLVRLWARIGGNEIAHASATVQDEAQMTADLDARVARLNNAADALYTRWLARLR